MLDVLRAKAEVYDLMMELIDNLCETIKTQSDIIDALYAQLSMQLTPDELKELPLAEMKRAAELRKHIEEG